MTIKAIATEQGVVSVASAASYTVSASVTTVAVPTFSVMSGTYEANQSVRITDTNSSATIYYTTDGSSPVTSTTRQVYSAPVTVSSAGTTMLTAYATESGTTPSPTVSATYTLTNFTTGTHLFQSSTLVSLAAGDLNGDGMTDLVGVESNGSLQVYLQSGGMLQSPVTYQPPSGATTAYTVAVGDLNGDGDADVAVGYGTFIELYTSNAQGVLTPWMSETTSNSRLVRIADVTGDGHNDLVGLAWSGSSNDLSVFPGTNGTLGPELQYSVNEGGYPQMAVGDVSGDGRNDVVVMSGQLYSTPAFSVLTQTTSGTLNPPINYTLPVSSTLPEGLALGDLSGDSKLDVAVSFGDTTPAPQIALYLQGTAGTLSTPASTVNVGERPAQLAIRDVNGDGINDVIAVNSYNYGVDVYEGTGNDSYAAAVHYAGGNNFDELVTGDFTGDGKIDLVGASSAGTAQGIVLFAHR